MSVKSPLDLEAVKLPSLKPTREPFPRRAPDRPPRERIGRVPPIKDTPGAATNR